MKAIALPLPANAVVADALSPFEKASPEDGNRCHSKYWRHPGEDSLGQNIVDSAYWKDHKEDTIFLSIISAGETIPFDECRFAILERQKPQEAARESRSMSRSTPQRKEVAECAESLEQLERALAEAKAKHAALVSKSEEKKRLRNEQQSPMQDQRPIKREESAIKTEQMSPARRVSFESHPTRQGAREDAPASFGAIGSAKSNGTPSKSMTQNSPIEGDSTPNKRFRKSSSNGSDHHQYRHEPPPPPPPPEDRRPQAESGSPPSAGFDHFGYNVNTENGPGYFEHHTDPYATFNRSRSDYSGNRKRNYESSSDESDTPKRQEDDVTPKLKRRQPKVAEAYR